MENSEKKTAKVHSFKHKAVEHHDWVQRGNHIICESCLNQHSAPVPPGKMLVKKEGEYALVDM